PRRRDRGRTATPTLHRGCGERVPSPHGPETPIVVFPQIVADSKTNREPFARRAQCVRTRRHPATPSRLLRALGTKRKGKSRLPPASLFRLSTSPAPAARATRGVEESGRAVRTARFDLHVGTLLLR